MANVKLRVDWIEVLEVVIRKHPAGSRESLGLMAEEATDERIVVVVAIACLRERVEEICARQTRNRMRESA